MVQENVFYDILERKNASLGYKNKKFKKSENLHFYKEVNPWLLSKNGHFSNFFFRQYRPGKCLLRYSRTKKCLSRLLKQEVQKVEKLTFLKGLTHGFGAKMAIFPTFFFQAIQARKMCFTIFQNEKMPFQAIKTRSSKSRKIDIFPKMAIFPTFFLANVGQENVFYHILQKKKAFFQAIKTRSSNNRKIDIFPKGITHGFGPKMAIFPTFFFFAIQAKKMSFTIFLNEKRLSRL